MYLRAEKIARETGIATKLIRILYADMGTYQRRVLQADIKDVKPQSTPRM